MLSILKGFNRSAYAQTLEYCKNKVWNFVFVCTYSNISNNFINLQIIICSQTSGHLDGGDKQKHCIELYGWGGVKQIIK